MHDAAGRSALSYAVRFGHTNCARLLLQHKASVDNQVESTGTHVLFDKLCARFLCVSVGSEVYRGC